MHPRIADVTPRARPGRAIEVPKGVGVTPLIPWPQAALAPHFSFDLPSHWLQRSWLWIDQDDGLELEPVRSMPIA